MHTGSGKYGTGRGQTQTGPAVVRVGANGDDQPGSRENMKYEHTNTSREPRALLRSQSTHSSEEASNDRGAKGCRKEDRPGPAQQALTMPASVARLTQGNPWQLWEWAEPAVWTESMLAALNNGVKGGVWYSLIDKVFALDNLASAAKQVCANQGAAGVDHVSTKAFASDMEGQLARIRAEIMSGKYRPQPIRREYIDKLGSTEQRPLGIPTVRDRVVQRALLHVLQPIYEQTFARHSYGFRPGKGCKDALRRVNELLTKGYEYVVDIDLQDYFGSIPHKRLLARLRERVVDGKVLELVEGYLKVGILEDMQEHTPTQGAPQGAVISPLLSNIYLNPLDQQLAQAGLEMVRYADDIVILSRSKEEAQRALELVQAWCAAEELRLHPDKTKIVNVTEEGFDFLGYHFWTTRQGDLRKRPRKKSMQKLKERIRAQTKRTSGKSTKEIIQKVNSTLRGWFGYFKHSLKNVFAEIDGWVRCRLRSILRKRQGRRGKGVGYDHIRWPNKFFAEQGLYSLEQARASACQPPRGKDL